MGEEYRGKVFRSGNSVALRLPKALGFVEGTEVRLIESGDGSFKLERTDPAPKIDVDKIWGIWRGCDIKLAEDRSFDPRPSGWPDNADPPA